MKSETKTKKELKKRGDAWRALWIQIDTRLTLVLHELDLITAERNELKDRSKIVIDLLEKEVSHYSAVPYINLSVEEQTHLTWCKAVMVNLRPSRLTPEAWEGQEIR